MKSIKRENKKPVAPRIDQIQLLASVILIILDVILVILEISERWL